MTDPTWTVNKFHAAACMSTTEINRTLKNVFDTTNDLPKTWKQDDPYGTWSIDVSKMNAPTVSFTTDLKNGVNLNSPIATGSFKNSSWVIAHGNPKKETKIIDLAGITFSLQTNMANIEHYAGGYALLDQSFKTLEETDKLSKVLIETLRIPLENENYKTDTDYLKAVTNALVDSASTIIFNHASVVVNESFYTKLKDLKVKDSCITTLKGELKSNYANLSDFWADCDGCVLDAAGVTSQVVDEALSYDVTDANFATIAGLNTVDSEILNPVKTAVANQTKPYADIHTAIVTAVNTVVTKYTTQLKNAAYIKTLDAEFTVQSLYADLENPHMLTDIASSKQVKLPYDQKLDLAAVLTGLIKDPIYKKSYVFGISKIPNVKATTGPFTPRSMRFSTYQDANDKSKGSLNWNIMVDATSENVPLPDLSQHATAGKFDQMPIPTNVAGVMIVSYGKLIREIILPKGFSHMGLDGSKFDDGTDDNHGVASLNTDVDMPSTDNIKKGQFTKGNTNVYPDPANNRIKVDFQIDNIELADKFAWPEAVKGGVLGIIAKLAGKQPKYRATWSGYITFSLDSDQNLTSSYSQTKPSLEIENDEGAWRYILDITSLGLHELDRFLNDKLIDSTVTQFVANEGKDMLPNLVNVVELPGEAVYTYTALDWYYLGLRAHLHYTDKPPYSKLACSQEGTVRSTSGDQGTLATFHNQSGGTLTLHWIDYQGKLPSKWGTNQQPYVIQNNASLDVWTYVTHPFAVYNDKNECIYIYRIDAKGKDDKMDIYLK